MVSQTRSTAQIFGINRTVGYVQGQTEIYTLDESGKFVRASDPLKALTTQELESLAASLLPSSMPIKDAKAK